MIEEWRAAPGFEGLYEVSSEGQVRSLPREVSSTNRWGVTGVRKYQGKTLRPTPNEKGYLSLRLCQGWGNPRRRVYVHRLVAEAFLPNPEEFEQVLHWDDTPSNNRVTNLRWGNQSMNELDKVRNRGI